MGRNSGRSYHRTKKFKPPVVKELTPNQNYGVITKFHGGAQRYMDVTVFNAVNSELESIRCRLKGGLRHSKCKQKVIIGSYCCVDGNEVIIIYTINQHSSIPETTFAKLGKVQSRLEAEKQQQQSHQQDDIDFMPDYSSDEADEADEDDIVFGTGIDHTESDDDIDAI